MDIFGIISGVAVAPTDLSASQPESVAATMSAGALQVLAECEHDALCVSLSQQAGGGDPARKVAAAAWLTAGQAAMGTSTGDERWE